MQFQLSLSQGRTKATELRSSRLAVPCTQWIMASSLTASLLLLSAAPSLLHVSLKRSARDGMASMRVLPHVTLVASFRAVLLCCPAVVSRCAVRVASTFPDILQYLLRGGTVDLPSGGVSTATATVSPSLSRHSGSLRWSSSHGSILSHK